MMFIGVDTSNYTASVCALDEKYIFNKRQILSVKQGERGIRQSEGVFQHMKIFPRLYNELRGEIDISKVMAVGVSTKPRNVEGSYMPVFLAGMGYARVIADTLGVPLYEFSHQDGHIMAGIRSSKRYDLLKKEFISVHLSGGTTEILTTRYNGYNFDNSIIGGTLDISAGQLIDRIGVKLGMPFPAGKHMERYANDTDKKIKFHIKTNGTYMNISGIETKASRMADNESNIDIGAVSRGILECIGDALNNTVACALKDNGLDSALISGGVASNNIIREGLFSMPFDIAFASKEFATDNAMGIAELTRLVYGSKNRNSIPN